MSIPAGSTGTLKILALPEGYSLSDIVYESEDPSVASIQDGIISAAGSGSTTVSAVTKDGKYRTSCSVIVPQVSGG